MEPLNIKSTEDTPKVIFDPPKDVFELSGRSLPEDVNEFYQPVFEWLNNYFLAPNDKTVIYFNFQYFNTASSKIIVDILNFLDEKFDAGFNVEVKWFAVEEDEDIIDMGEEFKENINLPFELIIEQE